MFAKDKLAQKEDTAKSLKQIMVDWKLGLLQGQH